MCEVTNVLTNWMMGALSQCIHISSHHIMYFIIIFVNYISIKLKNKVECSPLGSKKKKKIPSNSKEKNFLTRIPPPAKLRSRQRNNKDK